MIGKISKGKGFRGVLDYALKKDGAEIVGGNMAGNNARQLAHEFGEVRKLNDTNRPVFHTALAIPPGEKLTSDQWREIADRYMLEMGFDNNQYVAIRHKDTDHDHIHIIANRVRFDGKVTDDAWDYRRQEKTLRSIERDYGLSQVRASQEAERRAPTKNEIEMTLRTGEPSTKARLQDYCEAALKDCKSFTEYVERLRAADIDVIPTLQKDGTHLSGIQYRLDGVTMKGSDLGKKFTAAGIQKAGATYDKDRDFQAANECIERAKARDASKPTRDTAQEASRISRGDGNTLETASVVNGEPVRADNRSTQPDRRDSERAYPEQQESGQHLQNGSRGSSRETAGSNERIAESTGSAGRGPQHITAQNRTSDSDRYCTDYERIVNLGSVQMGRTESERITGRRENSKTHSRRDRTAEAITAQVEAFGTDRFEVGIRDQKTGKIMNREWSRDELLKNASWLKHMNAKGNDIYIRPAGNHSMVLLDDIKRETIERMKRDGYQPACVVETSPGNYQAWVKLDNEPMTQQARTYAAKALAQKYQADPASADGRHYGRLAGFTNTKPQYERDGKQPFVLLHEHDGKEAPFGKAIADIARDAAERDRRIEAIQNRTPKFAREETAIDAYQRYAAIALERYGTNADLSRVDWFAAKGMARENYSAEEIANAIKQASPNVAERKRGHLDDYATRTATKAIIEVEREREQQQQYDHDRGFGMSR